MCISVKQINATCYGDSVKWDDAVEWGVVVKEVARLRPVEHHPEPVSGYSTSQ